MSTVRLTINGKAAEAEKGRSLLEACREIGIKIPTLCYHPALEPSGACRLCVVEISSPTLSPRLVASCVYPCEEGLVVNTESEMVHHSRRITAELLMAVAYNTPEIAELAEKLGVKEVRFKMPEAESCILCGRCVRACKEIVGVSAISLIQRGISKKVSTPFQVSSSTCIGCGTCVVICPTGRLKFSDITGLDKLPRPDSEYIRLYGPPSDVTDLRPYFIQE